MSAFNRWFYLKTLLIYKDFVTPSYKIIIFSPACINTYNISNTFIILYYLNTCINDFIVKILNV